MITRDHFITYKVLGISAPAKVVKEEPPPIASKPTKTSTWIPAEGIELTKLFEQCHLSPYLDSVNVPTIGWGMTHYSNGNTVSMDDPPLSQEKADKEFEALIVDYWADLTLCVPGILELSEGKKSAFLSFSYNTGYRKMGTGSFNTLDKIIKEKRWNDLEACWMLYDNDRMDDGKQNNSTGVSVRRYSEILLMRGLTAKDAYKEVYRLVSANDDLDPETA